MFPRKQTSPWLRGALYVVAILFLPTFIIQLVRPDALSPGAHRPTLRSFEFSFLLETGTAFEKLHWHDPAIAEFQAAEQLALQSGDAGYESVREARAHLAGSYASAGRASDAEKMYAAIVKTSLEAGDALREKSQFEAAVPKYQDAEQFSQRLTTAKLASLLRSQRSLAGCLMVLKRYSDLAAVNQRIIVTLTDQGESHQIELGDAYEALAMAQSGMNDWARAEQSLLQAKDVYDQIVDHSSGNDLSDDARKAAQQRDFLTYSLAVCYFNEKKMELALSTDEDAFLALSARLGPVRIPAGVYTVGLQAANALGNQDQVETWKHRIDDLSPNHSAAAEESLPAQIPQVPRRF